MSIPEKMNYPSNSHRNKEEKVEEKKVQRITTCKVVKQKKSLWKKFMDTFFGEDTQSVGSYILYDVLIPAAKDTVVDMVKGGIDVAIVVNVGTDPPNKVKTVNPELVTITFPPKPRRDDRRQFSNQSRVRHNFDDIILSSNDEANSVLDHLVELIYEYREATVADLYNLVGIARNILIGIMDGQI